MTATQTPPIIYNLFPRLVGPFRNWRPHLERAAGMGFNWVFLNPVQVCGYSGSMYAIKDPYQIDPRYIDPASNLPHDGQFQSILGTAHDLGLKVMLDLVVNHTAFDSVLVTAHPDWYVHDAQGRLAHPGAPDTGEVWGDLATLDHEHSRDRDNLWRFWEDLTLHYLALGVDGFRCDAAYQVPIPFWQRIMSGARRKKPEAKFFAETLGCDFRLVVELARAGFDYNFNSSKWWNFRESWALQQYDENRRNGLPSVSFPDSHDTTRLAADLNGNLSALKMRYLFSAVFSTGVMMVAGYEFCFRRRLHVVHTGPGDWEAAQCDLTGFIRATNALKARCPVFHEESRTDVVYVLNPQILVLRKTTADERHRALIVLNIDAGAEQYLRIDNIRDLLGQPREMEDLSVEFKQDRVSDPYEARLAPAQSVVLYGRREA